MDKIAEIAGKLSDEMQRCLKTPYRGSLRPDLDVGRARVRTLDALQRRGLTDEVDQLTRLGLAVRKHLNGE